jgi:selenide,water dikinase
MPSGNNVLVGVGDDAGVYLISGNQAIVETVDIITPIVNDPFTFGAISAANSISDVYAMGGKPLTALAVVGFPICDFETNVISEILKGALQTLKRAGAYLIGGHSFENPEIKFGLSVTGIVDKDKILRQKGANAGDIIILTKPLGIGILTTSLKGGILKDNEIDHAKKCMLTLNNTASEAAIEAKASSATDVTGFGLLGHAHNMVSESKVDFVIENKNVPLLERTKEMVSSGMVPAGAYKNLDFFKDKIEFSKNISAEDQLILADPQTSGGLLITLERNALDTFEKMKIPFAVIGRVEKGTGQIKII